LVFEILSLRNTSVNFNSIRLNFFLHFSDLLRSRLNGGLQLSGLRSVFFNLGSDRSFLLFKISLLFLNDSCEFFFRFLADFIDLFTSIIRFFLLFLDFSNNGLLGMLNLFLNVGNLLFHHSGLLCDDLLLILLSLNLILDHTDLLLSFFGDSGSLRFDKLGLVDFLNFLCINILGLFLRNDALSLLLKNMFFLSLLFLDGRFLDSHLGNEL